MNMTAPMNPPPKKSKPLRWTWRKPKDKPKRNLSGYNMFFSDVRKEIMLERHGATNQDKQKTRQSSKDKVPDNAGFLQTVSEKWRNLESNVKERYLERARLERDRYKTALALWEQGRAMKSTNKSPANPWTQDGAITADSACHAIPVAPSNFNSMAPHLATARNEHDKVCHPFTQGQWENINHNAKDMEAISNAALLSPRSACEGLLAPMASEPHGVEPDCFAALLPHVQGIDLSFLLESTSPIACYQPPPCFVESSLGERPNSLDDFEPYPLVASSSLDVDEPLPFEDDESSRTQASNSSLSNICDECSDCGVQTSQGFIDDTHRCSPASVERLMSMLDADECAILLRRFDL